MTDVLYFFKINQELKEEIPLHVWIGLILLMDLSNNEPGFYVNTVEKNANKSAKWVYFEACSTIISDRISRELINLEKK